MSPDVTAPTTSTVSVELSGAAAAAVRPSASHAFGGIWRLTARRFFIIRHWLVLAAFGGMLVVFSIPAAPNHAAAARSFLAWASRFYVCFVVPLLAFIGAASLMRDDLKPDSVDYILTRPIRRPLFVVFRFLSHVACAELEFLLALAVVVGIGVYHGVPGLWPAVPLLAAGQFFAVIAFSAFGFLCALLSGRYIIIGLFYGAVIEVGIGNVPTQLNQLSMVRHVMVLMRPVLGEAEMGISTAADASALSVPAAVTALIGFAVVMLAATVAIFTFKELAGAGGRDT